MKYNNYGALMILALALIVGAPAIQAQTRVQANVPFDFNLGQKLMEAGVYDISSPDGRVLIVRNVNTREGCLMLESMHIRASQANGIPHAKLVFYKYDDQYFLAQIWDGLSDVGIAFPESKREKELKLARKDKLQPELVVIAMR